jgi:hypothetical protein
MRSPRLRIALLSFLFVLAPLPAFAARSLTLYLDGALVEQQESALKGYLEFSLPAGATPDSLRIRPERGVAIVRVLTAPRKPAKEVARELATLADREGLLHDRLKALSVREEIFKAAAKSQSAKAPRRTRTNPEPLSTIRQGTDYAISQLESVYQAKRKTEKELALLAERRATLQKDEAGGGSLVKVWVTPAKGRVTASWMQADRLWTPSYQLRVTEHGEAFLALHADGVTLARGEAATLRLSRVQSAISSGFAYAGEAIPLQKLSLKLERLQGGEPQTPLSLSLVNTSGIHLPAGDTVCFQSGVYMGKAMFHGADAGSSAEIICNGR